MPTNPTDAELVARLRAPEQWRSFPEPDDDAPIEAAARIEALAAEITVLRAAQEWRPIESAPRTSHSILVWCEDRRNCYTVCWWDNAWRHFGGRDSALTETPTHWLPLPAPPKSVP